MVSQDFGIINPEKLENIQTNNNVVSKGKIDCELKILIMFARQISY